VSGVQSSELTEREPGRVVGRVVLPQRAIIGVDIVDIERLRRVLGRSPAVENRLFSATEREYSRSKKDPVRHYAGTLAAKEAVIKAARLGVLGAWSRRIEITRDCDGVPVVSIDGKPADVSVSISHDGGMAVAAALALPPDGSSR
jgi:holo-[acyl-carrier protein] synthase